MHILIADILKSPTGIDEFASSIGQIANLFPWYTISSILVGDLANNGWRFSQYGLVISSIPVGDFRMSAKRICIIYMYVLSNSSIPVGDLANTGWRFGQYRLVISSIRLKDQVCKEEDDIVVQIKVNNYCS